MEIWIGRDGERHGPYKEDDVRQWLRSGQVSPKDLAWYEGLADWQPLSVLFPDEATATPPPPAGDNSYAASAAPSLPQMTTAALEDHAGFWKRVGAWAIDYLVLCVPITVIAIAMGANVAFEHLMTQVQNGVAAALAATEYVKAVRSATLLALLVGYVYYVIFEFSKWQATPGKLMLGMRVTNLNGQRLSLSRSLARNAVRLVNALTVLIPFVCYLPVAWTARKQGFHDMLAKTLVLNGRASEFSTDLAPDNSRSFSA
ncbi:MAG: RDD family protein [Rhodanobacter sp.]